MLNILSYPPTEDQLKIIDKLYEYAGSATLLWTLRILSGLLVLVSLYFWYKLISKRSSKFVATIFLGVVLIVPTIWVNILNNPYECVLFLGVSILTYFFVEEKKHFYVVLTLFVVLFNLLVFKERSSFIHGLSINDAVNEVSQRFGNEDALIDPINIPLNIRRITYNKYYFVFKREIGEIIKFFDVESWFYQEVPPTEQKSIVIFFWPEIFLFGSGIYLACKKRNVKLADLLVKIWIISLISFLMSPNAVYRKFTVVIIPISIMVALAVAEIRKTKNLFSKIMAYVLVVLTIYGSVGFVQNFEKRIDFWLDNRPLYFDFVYKNIKQMDYMSYDKIYVGSMVGNSKLYCRYYLDYCKSDKLFFDGFDNKTIEKNSIYTGFAGEFVGSEFKNNINENWKNIIESRGMEILDIKEMRDTIAYRYGNYVIVARTKNE